MDETILLAARAALLSEQLGEILASIGTIDLVKELSHATLEATAIATQLRELER